MPVPRPSSDYSFRGLMLFSLASRDAASLTSLAYQYYSDHDYRSALLYYRALLDRQPQELHVGAFFSLFLVL